MTGRFVIDVTPVATDCFISSEPTLQHYHGRSYLRRPFRSRFQAAQATKKEPCIFSNKGPAFEGQALCSSYR